MRVFWGWGGDPTPLKIFFRGLGGGGGGAMDGRDRVQKYFETFLDFWEVPIIFLGGGAKVFEKTLYPLPQK